jgi:NADH-quinone oxidoreductase subunit C
VGPGRNLEVLRFLKEDPAQDYDFLKDVMGVDLGGGRPIQVWYQLWSMEHGRELRVTCEVPRDNLSLESVYPLWRTANWLEREVYDMFGVEFEDHPDLRRILMPRATLSHPLRKDYPLSPRKDFQERRPEVAQEHGAERPGHHLGEVDDSDPVEGQGHDGSLRLRAP